MDRERTIGKLSLTVNTHAATVAAVFAAAFLPSLLLHGLSPLSPSLYSGICLVIISQSGILTALALVCRPDAQPSAKTAGLTLTSPLDQPPGPWFAYPPPRSSFLTLGQARLAVAVAEACREAPGVVVFVVLRSLSGSLGVLGSVQLRNACLHLGRVAVEWRQLKTIFWVTLFQSAAFLGQRRQILAQPVLQRDVFRSIKLAAPSAFLTALSSALSLLLFLPGASSWTTCLCSLPHWVCQALALAAYQAVFTQPTRRQQGAQAPQPPRVAQLLQGLATQQSISPVQQSWGGADFLPRLSRFHTYRLASSLCQLAESSSAACTRERQDLFASKGEYVRLMRCCVSRLDLMTLRVRDSLGTPLQGGAARVLATQFPDLFAFSEPIGPPALGLIGTGIGASVAPPASDGETWPPSLIFFDFKLCEWSARAAAALTIASITEDQQGSAQSSGTNAAILSSLLSALLACEELKGAHPGVAPTWADSFVSSKAPLHRYRDRGSSTEAFSSSQPHRQPQQGQQVLGLPVLLSTDASLKEAAALADILRGCVMRMGGAFGPQLGSSTSQAWGWEKDPLFGSRADHGLKLQELMTGRWKSP